MCFKETWVLFVVVQSQKVTFIHHVILFDSLHFSYGLIILLFLFNVHELTAVLGLVEEVVVCLLVDWVWADESLISIISSVDWRSGNHLEIVIPVVVGIKRFHVSSTS